MVGGDGCQFGKQMLAPVCKALCVWWPHATANGLHRTVATCIWPRASTSTVSHVPLSRCDAFRRLRIWFNSSVSEGLHCIIVTSPNVNRQCIPSRKVPGRSRSKYTIEQGFLQAVTTRRALTLRRNHSHPPTPTSPQVTAMPYEQRFKSIL